MTVSIRASLVLGALSLAGLALASLAGPAASGEELAGAAGRTNVEGLCATGAEQSPVNLSGAAATGAERLGRHWKPARGGLIVNTGETVEIEVDDAGGVTLSGVAFALKEVRFRHPSEHTIDGRRFPLEAQLIHRADDGRIAAVSVLFDEGRPSDVLEPIWSTTPGRRGKAAVAFSIDPAAFLPTEGSAFRYQGSQTTPPCAETATWTVYEKPVSASRSQIAAFASLFPDNARSLQPLNRRYVLKAAL